MVVSAAATESRAATPREPGRRRRLKLEARLRRLPRDVGVVVLAVGVAGLVIPGPLPPGTPLLLAGAVFVSPCLVRPVGSCLQRHLPSVYRVFEGQVGRFQSDLERRYPGSTGRGRKARSGGS